MAFTHSPFAKTSNGPDPADSQRSPDCHSPCGLPSARHRSLHISHTVGSPNLRQTDAAAQLISSESMTKSLWKHFYLCVCLCRYLWGPLAGLPRRARPAGRQMFKDNSFNLTYKRLQSQETCNKSTAWQSLSGLHKVAIGLAVAYSLPGSAAPTMFLIWCLITGGHPKTTLLQHKPLSLHFMVTLFGAYTFQDIHSVLTPGPFK